MGDDPSLRRQWILLRSLTSSRLGLTVREMAREAGVAERTIRRDLETFRSVGFPVEESVGDFGRKRWRLPADKDRPTVGLSFDEAAALHLGRRFLEPLAGTAFWDAATRGLRKIRASLGDQALGYLERFAVAFHRTLPGASDYSRQSELIDGLMVGIEDMRAVHILYRSDRATEPATRDVYPYGLAHHRGSLYLVALDPGEGRIKHYKVDRIEEVEVSNFPFRRPPDFDLAGHLAPSFGIYQGGGDVEVKVLFRPPAARYVQEGRWHPSQRLARRADGAVVAEFRLSGTEEIKHWILGFGARAVVLEPEGLRREMAAEAEAMHRAYAAVGTAPAGKAPASGDRGPR